MSARLRPAAVVLCVLDARHLAAGAEAIADLGRAHHTIVAGSAATAEWAERLGVHHAAGDPVATADALAAHPPTRAAVAPRAAGGV
jgi:hypothetical protein